MHNFLKWISWKVLLRRLWTLRKGTEMAFFEVCEGQIQKWLCLMLRLEGLNLVKKTSLKSWEEMYFHTWSLFLSYFPTWKKVFCTSKSSQNKQFFGKQKDALCEKVSGLMTNTPFWVSRHYCKQQYYKKFKKISKTRKK